MNESVEADPTDALKNTLPLPVRETLDIDYPERAGEPPLEPRREGLPPSFRMRHDKHYVEELMSGPTITQASAYPLSARPSGPTASASQLIERRTPAEAHTSAAAVELLARRLEAVVAHDAITREHTASVDLVSRTVQAELQRVSRFARAIAVSTRHREPVRRSVTVAEIAAAVRSACTTVARLNGADFLVTAEDAAFAIPVERALLEHGIAGTVDALLDMMRTVPSNNSPLGTDDGERITVSLRAVRTRPALIVDVECPTLTWRTGAADRFFDNTDQDFAAAPAAGLLLASAAVVVRLHGGRAEVQLQRGVSVRYVLPQDAPRAAL